MSYDGVIFNHSRLLSHANILTGAAEALEERAEELARRDIGGENKYITTLSQQLTETATTLLITAQALRGER